MKICAIEVQNFRKFVGKVRVSGFGDTLNVLCGNNEMGKTTLMAAINGVIFERAKSQTQTVKGFRHNTNGTVPEVKLSFEMAGKNYELFKRFAGPTGKTVLTQAGGARFEDDDAEAQLQRLFGFAVEGRTAETGIWGTLWVRQGESFELGEGVLGPRARTTIQNCIEAQVGAVTGGQRGQRIIQAVATAKGELLTTRGPKGEYKVATEALSEVEQSLLELVQKRSNADTQLTRLAELKRELKRLESDWNQDATKAELETARTQLAAAQQREIEGQALTAQLEVAEGKVKAAEKLVQDRDALLVEIKECEAAISIIQPKLDASIEAQAAAETAAEAADQIYANLRQQSDKDNEALARLSRARSIFERKAELLRYEDLLRSSDQLASRISDLTAQIAGISVTEDNYSEIEDADRDVAKSAAALNALATTLNVEVAPSEQPRIKIAGAKLGEPSATFELIKRTSIEIDGVGSFVIEPRIKNRNVLNDALQDAESTLRELLTKVAVPDVKSARMVLERRRSLENQLEQAKSEVASLLPKGGPSLKAAGLDGVRTHIATLRGRIDADIAAIGDDLPASVDELDDKLSQLESALRENAKAMRKQEGLLLSIKDQKVAADKKVSTNKAKRDEEAGALSSKQQVLKMWRDEAQDEAIHQNVIDAKTELNSRIQLLSAFRAVPGDDAKALQARIRRIESSIISHDTNVNRLTLDISSLSAVLDANQDMGLDELVDVTTGEKERLERRVAAYKDEAASLTLLLDVLEAAESEAKTRFLSPITERIQPYLSMLLPGAKLKLDEDLTVTAVERDGTEESFDGLSLGTQEQIAVLTRIAFAELLASQGRPAAIVLDDALVFSDDDRIERMFDILTRAAESVQIIVFTCRHRLFQSLGATSLSIVVAEEP